MRTYALGVFATFAIVAGSTTANAATTIYTDEMVFMQAQKGMRLVEDFNDQTLIPGLSIMTDAGSISGGTFNDRVVFGSDQTMFKKWHMRSFGGTFDLNPAGFGQGLNFSYMLYDGTTVNVGNISGYRGFYGFTTMNKFKKVTITAFDPNAGVAETYTLDNLKISMVPEPASWAMLISGFGLVGAVARRRRAVVAA